MPELRDEVVNKMKVIVFSCLFFVILSSSVSSAKTYWFGDARQFSCDDTATGSSTGPQTLAFSPKEIHDIVACVEFDGRFTPIPCQAELDLDPILFSFTLYDGEKILTTQKFQFPLELTSRRLCKRIKGVSIVDWLSHLGEMPEELSIDVNVIMAAQLIPGRNQNYWSSLEYAVYVAKKEGELMLDSDLGGFTHSVVCHLPYCYVSAGPVTPTEVETFVERGKSWPLIVWDHRPWTANTFSVTSFWCINPHCVDNVVVTSLDIVRLGCQLGCTHLSSSIPHLIVCAATKKLGKDAIPILVGCAKYDSEQDCEQTTDFNCLWIEVPPNDATRLGSSACVPTDLVPSAAEAIRVLDEYKSVLNDPDIPSYADIITCLTLSSDNPSGTCADGAAADGGRKVECMFCKDIDHNLSGLVFPPVTQLCLPKSLKAVCSELQNDAPACPADGRSSSRQFSTVLLSCMTSLCILLMS